MDISSRGSYPSNKLSNFAGHRFVIDGVQCNSMEGFLQSLKFKNPDMQREVCLLVGLAAKKKGANKKWKVRGELHWKGQTFKRNSMIYQGLLDKAYFALATQSQGFRNALKATGVAVLRHSIGRKKESETILTQREFTSRLTKLREKLLNGEV